MNTAAIPNAHAEVERLRDAARQLGVDRLNQGCTFASVISDRVVRRSVKRGPRYWDCAYPNLATDARAEVEIQRASRRASITGVLASASATAGELLTVLTDGLAAPVGIPTVVAAMSAEAAYTACIQLDLACDIASIYGVPFDGEDTGELTTLFALALNVDVKRPARRHALSANETNPIDGVLSKLISLDNGELATRVARELVEQSVLRNVVPVLGLAVSARRNYVATRRVGATVQRYARMRCAVSSAMRELRLREIDDASLLIQGAWLIATVDGEASHEELMAIAALLEELTPEQRSRIDFQVAFGDDEIQWLDKLESLGPLEQDLLLDILYLVLATDRTIDTANRRFLHRVGWSLHREISLDRIAKIWCGVDEGGALPGRLLTPERTA